MRLLTATAALVVSLVLAAPAMASDNGEGLLGETTDRVVTFICLGILVFITIFVTLASMLMSWLDKRKYERQAAELRRSVGW